MEFRVETYEREDILADGQRASEAFCSRVDSGHVSFDGLMHMHTPVHMGLLRARSRAVAPLHLLLKNLIVPGAWKQAVTCKWRRCSVPLT